jgi:hypothetical protein
VTWLLDEMLPPAAGHHLRRLGHDAVSVDTEGLLGASDHDVYARAVAARRCIVTENFGDFAAILDERSSRGETCVPVVFVRQDAHGRRGSIARHLADHLHRWAETNPDPYIGLHWP